MGAVNVSKDVFSAALGSAKGFHGEERALILSFSLRNPRRIVLFEAVSGSQIAAYTALQDLNRHLAYVYQN